MNLVSYIDHTTLKANTTKEDISRICQEAKEHGFFAVCVPPYLITMAGGFLRDSPVKIATVIGFPMGYSATAAKVEEIKRALNDGADEVDVVINICAVKNADWAYVRNDIDSCTRAAHLKGKTAKVIFETGLLEREEIKKLCELCTDLDVDYVKTSTGFNGEGASREIVLFLRENLPKKIKIKASGGIRTREDAIALIDSGASRLGSSAGVKLI